LIEYLFNAKINKFYISKNYSQGKIENFFRTIWLL
jgi:hypothetical protein